MGGSKQWSTICAVAQEVDVEQEVVPASKVTTTLDAMQATRWPLFI